MTITPTLTGGQILVKALQAHEVDTIFGVAGESYLAALDALYDAKDIRIITNRQEGGASFMAEAYGKLTGKCGICFVTRGPGATNASIGVHTARQDSTSMILFIGQVSNEHLGREAFQEIDYRAMFKPPMAKAVFQVEKTGDIAKTVAEAFRSSQSGRKGPVVVALPENILTEMVEAPEIPITPPKIKADITREMQRLEKLLANAERPICIIGGSGWNDPALAEFQAFAEARNLPVATSFRRQDLFDHNSPCYIGELGTGANPELVKRIREDSDLVIALNTRLSEITSQGYTLLDIPRPRQKFVHIYPDIDEHGKTYLADVGILSKAKNFVAYLDDIRAGTNYKDWCGQLRDVYENWTDIDKKESAYAVDMDLIFQHLREKLPENAIVTTDAGNFSGWAQRYLRYGRPGRLLAPTSGAMGYGVPAAISAAIAMPDKKVVALAGDGGFMMTSQELATAMAVKAAPIVIVFNNGLYGTIRMHQARDYPHRKIATDLHNPDFVALAKAYGANGIRVEKTAEFAPAFAKALKSKTLTLIEVVNSPEQITTTRRMSEIEGE